MKREMVAVGILVLILAASLVNIWFVDSRTEYLSSQIAQAGELADQGDTEEAEKILKASLKDWQALDNYVHIMLRHDEIDPITDEYYSLLDELESNGDSTSASFETLRSRLHELAEIEHLTFASIF